MHSAIYFAALISALIVGTSVRATNQDAQFVDELAERRLHRLVDEFCRERLADSTRSTRTHWEIAAAWIRSKAQSAMEAPPRQRARAWNELDQVGTALQTSAEGHDYAILVEIQLAAARLMQGRLARENAFISSAPADAEAYGPMLDDARAAIRAAIELFRTTSEDIDRMLAEAYRRRSTTLDVEAWTTRELESLRRNTAIQAATAYREQGLCYAPDSADRVNALSLALQQLAMLTSIEEIDPVLTWSARLEQIRSLRLLGRFDQAIEQLGAWLKHVPDGSWRWELNAEHIRMLSDRGEFRQAVRVAQEALEARTDKTPSAEFDDAFFAALIGVRNEAQEDLRISLTEQASHYARQIAARHGPYWHRRAEARLGRALTGSASETNDPALLLTAAKSLYAGGRHREAIDAYDRIADLSAANDDWNAAFEASATASAILAENGELETALARRVQLATEFRDHPRAPDEHLAAVALAAELSRDAAPQARTDRLEAYVALLGEQIQNWPSALASQTASWWLARYQMSRQRWDAALESLQLVTPLSDSYDEAVRSTLACYRAQLKATMNHRPESARRRTQLVALATERLNPVVVGQSNQLPQQWSQLQRHVALGLASLQLRHLATVHPYTIGILKAARADARDAPESWRRRATTLQAAAAARSGDIGDAESMLAGVRLTSSDAVELALCLRLDEPIPNLAHDDDTRTLGQFALNAIQSATAESEPLEGGEQNELQHLEAAALAMSGDRTAALTAYRQLATAHPDDGDLAAALAELLAAGNEREIQEALEAYRNIESRSKPGGARWLLARRARIKLLGQLGHAQQAAKLTRLTQALYPKVELDGQKTEPPP